MKIRHSELEQCRTNPRAWVASQFEGSHGHPTFGYGQALKLAIYAFHKTNDAVESKQYLSEKMKRFVNDVRKAECEIALERYITWMEVNSVIVADCKVRLNLLLDEGVTLGGEISRVDILPNDDIYRAILLGDTPQGWRRELRMPLIQHEISLKYSRPVDLVAVGFQSVDGSGLETTRYRTSRIKEAVKEAQEIGHLASGEWQRRSRVSMVR